MTLNNHMNERHRIGFAKHKGEIMKHSGYYIQAQVLEELADTGNYLCYLRTKCGVDIRKVLKKLNKLYFDVEKLL